MREIAEIAVVSEATVFNYFPSKADLASEWVREWVDSHFASPDIHRNLRHDVRDRVRQLAGNAAVERDLLESLWPRVRACRRGPCPGLEALLRTGQDRGEVRSDLTASEQALLVSGAVDVVLGQWLLGQKTGAPLAPQLLRATDLILDGCRKRNERVRAPADAFTRS